MLNAFKDKEERNENKKNFLFFRFDNDNDNDDDDDILDIKRKVRERERNHTKKKEIKMDEIKNKKKKISPVLTYFLLFRFKKKMLFDVSCFLFAKHFENGNGNENDFLCFGVKGKKILRGNKKNVKIFCIFSGSK